MKKKKQVMKKRNQGFLRNFNRQHVVVKIAAIVVAAIMVLSLAMPAFAEEKQTVLPVIEMSSKGDMEISSNVLPEIKAEDLSWYLNGKSFDQWKKWSMETGDFTADPYITFKTPAKIQNGKLTAKLGFDLLFDTTDLSLRRPFNVRLKYPEMIGTYEITAADKNNNIVVSSKFELVPYKGYTSYEQMTQKVQNIQMASKKDRFTEIQSYGTTAKGTDMKLGIIAKSKVDIDEFLSKTTPYMLNDPAAFMQEIDAKTIDYKIPIFMNNIHPDEQPGVDTVVNLFEDFATMDTIKYDTTDKAGKPVSKTINMSEVLDNFILVFSFTENPDGRIANTRTNSNGLDLNRDNSYQTQNETKAMSAQITKYNPLIFLDYHGFVSEFLIEPCTPPHDPNYETDLLYENQLENAIAMGNAGIANSKYESYLIPMRDWDTSWDDATSSYTATYAMHHGALGHTIEVPEMNVESLNAAIHTGYAAVEYAVSNKNRLMKNKLEYYLRGNTNVDDIRADKALIDSKGNVKGRPRAEGESFFPAYYVIPMGMETQKNTNAAFDMIAYFNRNGVKVSQLKEDVSKESLGIFKQGDLVIDMNQAKRGYANHVLYSGMDESEWSEMYAEIVMNFPVLRGFDIQRVMEKGAFDQKLEDAKWTAAPASKIPDGPYYMLHNNSNQSVMAVNETLNAGNDVYIMQITQSRQGFALDKNAMNTLSKKYPLKFEPITLIPTTNKLEKISVFADGSTTIGIVLKEMGFVLAKDAASADVIVTDSGSLDPEILGTKPVIAIGGEALTAIFESGKLAGLEVKSTDLYHEGLLKSVNDKSSMLTMGYPTEDMMYSSSGTWIEKLPIGFKEITKAKNSEDFYVAGWWPDHQLAMGKTLSAEGQVNGQKTYLYAGNLTNKLHPQYLYRWLSNAIYQSVAQ